MSEQFYMVLPSNSSMSIYPDNKISSFKVNLSTPLNLDASRWEVALQEIQFPHRWYNIRNGKNIIIKNYYNPRVVELNRFFPIGRDKDLAEETLKRKALLNEKEIASVVFKREIKISPGHYTNVDAILEQLRTFEVGDSRPIQYSMDHTTKKLSINLSDGCHLDFNNSDIGKILGFQPDSTIKVSNEKIQSDSMVDVSHTYDSVYVYTDIITNQHVGDYKVPLLRIVPVNSNFGEMNWIHYDRPHFVPLSRGNINDLEINLKDDTGELISFEAGKSIITLVFRRKTTKFYD